MTASPNPSRRLLLESSPWADRWPGLRKAAAGWLDSLDERLGEARQRADEILGTSFAGGGLLRLGQMAARAAPHVRGLIASRGDTEDFVDALADMAVRGGPTYVKLGQLIASTRGLVPDSVAEAFEGCRDQVPPAAAPAIRGVLRRSGVLDGLRSWDRRPIASASVAQVHRATLHDGTDVVVKVRRPRIVGTVAADVSYLMPVMRLAETSSPRARMANLSGSLELMIRLFAQEVDLRLEAANIAEMALAFERARLDVRVPAPVPGLVTKHAMVMEYIEGASWAEAPDVARYGHKGSDLVRVLLTGVLETTLVDGIFHGDLHPGNVFVDERGVALVDFGIVGRLDVEKRRAIAQLVFAVLARDARSALMALKTLGAIPESVDPEVILPHLMDVPSDDDVRRMMADHTKAAERFARLQRVLSENGFRIVPEMAIFGRNMIYLGEAIERHAPSFDLITEIAAIVSDFQRRHPGEPSGLSPG